MGIFDHRRTWEFRVHASPQACIDAFSKALNNSGGLVMSGKWSVASGTSAMGLPEACGTYAGRGGAIGALTMLSARASDERDAAIGSRLAFRVLNHDPGSGLTRCAMELTEWTTLYFFFVADARFFRSSMSGVARRFRALDPGMELSKT